MTHFQEVDLQIYQVIAKRTLVNLKHICGEVESYEDLKEKDVGMVQGKTELYEVTQTLNSMLGLLVFPKEKVLENIKPIQIAGHQFAGNFFISTDNYPPGKKCENLQILISRLRNSIAHFRVEFPKEKNYITQIEFRDKYPDDTDFRWIATVNVWDLTNFLMWFAAGIIDGSLLNT